MTRPTNRDFKMALQISSYIIQEDQGNDRVGNTAQETGPSHTPQVCRMYGW
jgi:hypothetical protein